LINAVSTQIVNVRSITRICIFLKVLCFSKYWYKKNYLVDLIIFSSASICALNAFSPVFVAR
jgi:hypothetical protein